MQLSNEAVTTNVKRIVHNLAAEAARRAMDDKPLTQDTIRNHVEVVLLDWFLGDMIA